MLRERSSPHAWLVPIPLLAGLLSYVYFARHENVATPADGTPAIARVVRSSDGNCMRGLRPGPCLALTLQVRPTGGTVFTTTLDVHVPEPWLEHVKPKSWVGVILTASEPKVALDLDGLAHPSAPPEGAVP